VTVGSLRADHLGAYGFPVETSPHLDALAARSIVFERAVAASSRTAPSHATMMTSLHVRQHALGAGSGTTRLADERTLAEYFREAGYATGAFVGNPTLTRRSGLDRGFEVYDDELPHADLKRPPWFERRAHETGERALAWLAAQTAPVLLWVQFQDPDGPYVPPPPFDQAFRLQARPGDRLMPLHENQSCFQGLPAYQALEGLAEPWQYRSRYAGEIRFVDEWLGKLVAAAEARSSERGIVILVTADHGESLGEGDWYFCHGLGTSPDQVHVPFVLHAPGFTPDRRRELVHHVDLMPTLLELAGLAVPKGARGVALGRVLRREQAMPERIVYADVGFSVSAYRGERFDRIRLEEMGGQLVPRSWESYEWRTDGSWGAAEPDPGVRPEISAYLSRVKAPAFLPPPTE
jgi:arylsulfatase A-like enzyme